MRTGSPPLAVSSRKGVGFVFKKLSVEEKLQNEREENLLRLNKQIDNEKVIYEQLVDLDFRQSLSELGVV